MQKSNAHTTVNLSISHASLIKESARKLRIKPSSLMALLLRKMMTHTKELKHEFRTVKYQRSGDRNWKKVHFFPEFKEYEVFTDMRNNCKFSVSFLLAMAIGLYLEELLSPEKKNIHDECDKYQILSYSCCEKVYKNYFCWHTIWVLNEALAKTLQK